MENCLLALQRKRQGCWCERFSFLDISATAQASSHLRDFPVSSLQFPSSANRGFNVRFLLRQEKLFQLTENLLIISEGFTALQVIYQRLTMMNISCSTSLHFNCNGRKRWHSQQVPTAEVFLQFFFQFETQKYFFRNLQEPESKKNKPGSNELNRQTMLD